MACEFICDQCGARTEGKFTGDGVWCLPKGWRFFTSNGVDKQLLCSQECVNHLVAEQEDDLPQLPKHPLQAVFDGMSKAMQVQRSSYHMTLESMIQLLREKPQDWIIMYDWNGLCPGSPMSYRGYYEDLAFDWQRDSFRKVTVSDFRKVCENTLHSTFVGYKGGNYTMGPNTPLWAASYGSTGRAIVGLFEGTDGVLIETREAD